jgi:hypothetical protein
MVLSNSCFNDSCSKHSAEARNDINNVKDVFLELKVSCIQLSDAILSASKVFTYQVQHQIADALKRRCSFVKRIWSLTWVAKHVQSYILTKSLGTEFLLGVYCFQYQSSLDMFGRGRGG